MLLAQSGEAFAWVRWVVLAAGVVAVACSCRRGRLRRAALVGRRRGGAGRLAAPAAYAVTTAATAHSGSIPSVGTSASAMGGPGGTGERGGAAGVTLPAMRQPTARRRAAPPQGHDGGAPGGMGGATSAELTALLSGDDVDLVGRRLLRAVGGGLELASGTAVMSTGGWSGSDAAVTLAQFQADVAARPDPLLHRRRPGRRPGRRARTAPAHRSPRGSRRTSPATTVGGQTVYDLTA